MESDGAAVTAPSVAAAATAAKSSAAASKAVFAAASAPSPWGPRGAKCSGSRRASASISWVGSPSGRAGGSGIWRHEVGEVKTRTGTARGCAAGPPSCDASASASTLLTGKYDDGKGKKGKGKDGGKGAGKGD